MTSGIGKITHGWICPKRNVTRIIRYILPLNLSLEEQQTLNLYLNQLDFFTLNLLLTQYLNLNIIQSKLSLDVKNKTQLNLQINNCEE
jgi:hypothetical protein